MLVKCSVLGTLAMVAVDAHWLVHKLVCTLSVFVTESPPASGDEEEK